MEKLSDYRTLQWGRDQLIAEMQGRIYCRIQWHGLQWGRDQLIAEIRDYRDSLGRLGRLQWGRDQLIAEIPRRACPTVRRRLASMGPRSADRGNNRCRSMALRTLERFNGAAIS